MKNTAATRPIGLPFLFLTLVLGVCGVGSSSAADYAGLQREIERGLEHVEELEYSLGRYNFQLMEPLEQLARTQLQANRFDEADATVDHAIQIARLSEGLYSKEQYRLLQLAIDVSRSRQDWDETMEQLDHLTWLIVRKFEGDPAVQLQTVSWMAETHLQSALDTDVTRRASHLIKATQLSEYAVQLAQLQRQTDDPIYVRLLHALSQKYYVETRGLFGGAEVSYDLRKLFSESEIISTRSDARDLRYLAGLEKLLMLRDVVAQSPRYNKESLAMAEIYLADWKLAYNHSNNIKDEYAKAIALLREAEIAEPMLARFFANPVVLPRPDFTLSFEEALASIEQATTYGFTSAAGTNGNPVASSTFYQLSVMEGAEELPGYVRERSKATASMANSRDWNTIALSVAIDPTVQSRTRNHGYMSSNYVTPSQVEIQEAENIDARELKKTLARIKSIPFRPALLDGAPVTATFSLNYTFRDSESASLRRLLTLQ